METITQDRPATALTGCECPLAGFCARHQCQKTEHYHHLCRTRPDYFAAWESGNGPCIGKPIKPTTKRRPSRALDLSCKHRTEQPIEIGKCDLCGGEKGQPFEIFGCALHGKCSLHRKHSKVMGCASCEDWVSVRPMPGAPFRFDPQYHPEFITNAQLMADVHRLVAMLPPDTSRIIGVARSGLCVATMAAMLMHRPMSIVRQGKGDLIEASNGWRLTGNTRSAGRAVFIDDTCMTGGSAQECGLPIVRKEFPDVLAAVVYANPAANLGRPDLFARELRWPHVLEWNFSNSILTDQMAVDFDGILCHDCAPADDDDGPRYAAFLRDAKPLYYFRRTPIPLIVTARLEKYRPETLAWLERHGMTAKQLVMWPGTDHRARNRSDVGAWKAAHFAEFMRRRHKHQPPLFVESDAGWAQRIAEVSGGIVVCPAAGKCFRGPEPAK